MKGSASVNFEPDVRMPGVVYPPPDTLQRYIEAGALTREDRKSVV